MGVQTCRALASGPEAHVAGFILPLDHENCDRVQVKHHPVARTVVRGCWIDGSPMAEAAEEASEPSHVGVQAETPKAHEAVVQDSRTR